ncbi:MAG: ATP-binding protein, partial [Firmicutes bacterium]|nr:ATP-binding protein [Bacillota bacterium]
MTRPMKYTDYEIQLNPGDRLFLYTDGVPEAFDDITMLGLKYFGPDKEEENKNMAELSIEATTDNLPVVEEFIEEHLTSMGCSIKAITQIGVAAEEIFVNIAHYAYAPETGMAKVSMEIDDAERKVQIIFEDSGI